MPVVQLPDATTALVQANALVSMYTAGRGDLDMVVLVDDALAADQDFVLIDLSDAAQFPHTDTNTIILYDLMIIAIGETSAQYKIDVGVVVEVDATDGTVWWLWPCLPKIDKGATDSVSWWIWHFPYPDGFDLEVDGVTDTMVNALTNYKDSADVDWQTDVALDSPVGAAASAPGDGDLVLQVDLTGGAGTISVRVIALYRTE